MKLEPIIQSEASQKEKHQFIHEKKKRNKTICFLKKTNKQKKRIKFMFTIQNKWTTAMHY